MAEVILITGGARSGKSNVALRLAERFKRRIFIATAQAFDDEMRERIAHHKTARGEGWETLETPLDLAGAIGSIVDPRTAVVIDCLTVWLGNLMHADASSAEDSQAWTAFFEALRCSPAARIILVTNEVGMSIVPENVLARRFRDAAGTLNQRVAAMADRVILIVCGQALTMKS